MLAFLSGAPRVTTRGTAEAGGPRAHVLGTINGFRALGWEVKPFIFGDRIHDKASKAATEKIVSASFVRRAIADSIRLGLGYANEREAWRSIGEVDWAYERLASFQALGTRFQRRGIPWIVESNGPFFYEARQDRKSMALSTVARRIEMRAYKECDVIVCVSEQLKRIIVDASEVHGDKVVVLPNGVDTELFDPTDVSATRLHTDFTIGFVGTLTHWQRLDMLIDAVASLRARGVPVAATVVGSGLAKTEWQRYAHAKGVAEAVAFVGRVDREDVPKYVAGFDVGYSGPGRSGLGTMYHSPLKLYEYMSMARPVLAAAYDDALKLVEGKNTGFLFQPESGPSLVTALSVAFDSRDRLEQMGRAARREILASHSWPRRVRKLIEEVNAILAVRSKRPAVRIV